MAAGKKATRKKPMGAAPKKVDADFWTTGSDDGSRTTRQLSASKVKRALEHMEVDPADFQKAWAELGDSRGSRGIGTPEDYEDKATDLYTESRNIQPVIDFLNQNATWKPKKGWDSASARALVNRVISYRIENGLDI